MKIPSHIALWLQFNLYLMTLEGYSPDAFTCWPPGTCDDQKLRWRLAVDFIHRCLVCGLMEVWNDAWMKAVGVDDPQGLVKALAQHDPFNEVDFRESGATYWLEPLLYGTDLCKSLIEKYSIKEFEESAISEPFIEHVESLFDRHGVGWGKCIMEVAEPAASGLEGSG
jgi:hypothetical protein